LLDHLRGLRNEKNSKSMLEPLISNHEKNFELYLYHTPSLRGLSKKFIPERTNETVGVMHMKMYITDDDLIISGYIYI
jgi:CDP-diacylglycerol---glycerol-3-phosphate 3-phosphatidyltransferase